MARSITTRSINPKIMDDNIKILDDALAIASAPPAEDVVYDNTNSGLTATDVQAAIDEISTPDTFTIAANGEVSITRQLVKIVNKVVYFSVLFVVSEETATPLTNFIKPAGTGADSVFEVNCVITTSQTLVPAIINNSGSLAKRANAKFAAGTYALSGCYIID